MTARLSLATIAAVGGAMFLGACSMVEWPIVSGKSVYNEYCVMCHGASGTGDGALADDLFTRPTDLTRLSLDNDGDFPRVRVLSHIDGYLRGENSSGAMPEFGLLLAGENVLMETGEGVVTPTPKPMLGVVNYLERIQVTE